MPSKGKNALFSPAGQDAKNRYTNIADNLPSVSGKVRAKFFLGRIASTFSGRSGAPNLVPNDGALLRENAKNTTSTQPTVTWVGHATMLVQMEHVTFLTDPIWSNKPSPVPFAGPKRFVKPGITGLAAIKGYRGGTDDLDLMTKRTELDIWYLENWSLWLDIKIIAITIWQMATFRIPKAY